MKLAPTGILTNRDLLMNLTLRELRSKYKRSALGWAWSMVNPLATMLIFSMVFSVFLRIPPPVGEATGLKNFALFLLCGLLPWNFLSNSLNGSIRSLVQNSGLIKKVYFPRGVLPAASVLSWNVNLLIELAILAVVFLAVGNFVIPWLPIAFLIVVIQTLFVIGLGLALAAVNVYFRDVEHFLSIILLLWFYASPIVYPSTLVPESVVILGSQVPIRAIYNVNPMVHFIGAYRSVFYDLTWPNLGSTIYMLCTSGLSFALGWGVFRRLQGRFAEEL